MTQASDQALISVLRQCYGCDQRWDMGHGSEMNMMMLNCGFCLMIRRNCGSKANPDQNVTRKSYIKPNYISFMVSCNDDAGDLTIFISYTESQHQFYIIYEKVNII